MARPSEYNFDLCVEICDEIAKGRNVIETLNSDNRFPDWTTFRRWKNNNEELRTLYVNSQQDKAIALENEIDDLRAMLLSKEIEYPTYNALVNTLKWKMAKMYAKLFGDKVDVTTQGEKINQPQAIQIEIVKANEAKGDASISE
jgi:hypothetical protein